MSEQMPDETYSGAIQSLVIFLGWLDTDQHLLCKPEDDNRSMEHIAKSYLAYLNGGPPWL